MSFADRLVLWLHIAFVIFTIGPVTLAISSTPRYIRKRDLPILRYLSRITTLFTFLSLGVLAAGIGLAQIDKDFRHPWLTISVTLYVVAVVLLVLIIRDQRKAIRALDELAGAGTGGPDPAADPATAAGPEATQTSAGTVVAGVSAPPGEVANVERGRIAMMGGVVNLIWLVVLVLMIWQP